MSPTIYSSSNPHAKDTTSVQEHEIGSGSTFEIATPDAIERVVQYGSEQNTNLGQRSPRDRSLAGRCKTIFHIFRDWALEITAALLMFVFLAVEIIVLAYYDMVPTSEWLHEWKINSVFAFITTLLEACLTTCVVACIGQLRWLWYEKREDALLWMDKLTNMKTAFAAVMFLFAKGSYKHFVGVGALITVALLGTQTFVQNVIVTRSSLIPDDQECSVYILTQYGWHSQERSGQVTGDQRPIAPMIGAIESGYFAPGAFGDSETMDDTVDCETGNCEFDYYQSLAVCSQCVDLTSSVLHDQDVYWMFAYPDITLDATSGFLNMTSSTLYPISDALPQGGPLIASFQGMGALNISSPGYGSFAMECAIYWCVEQYHGSMGNYSMNETITGDWTDLSLQLSYDNPVDIELTPPDCYSNGTVMSSGDPDCTFTATKLAHRALQNYLTGVIVEVEGSYEYEYSAPFLYGSVSWDDDQTGWVIDSDAASAVYYAGTSTQVEIYSFSDAMEYSIASMTQYMTYDIRRTNNTGGPQFSYGDASLYVQYFHVRWLWMAYPVGLVLCSMTFLIITIIKCHRSNTLLWKDSVMAMMVSPLPDSELQELIALGRLDKIREAMEKRKVRLVNHRFMSTAGESLA